MGTGLAMDAAGAGWASVWTLDGAPFPPQLGCFGVPYWRGNAADPETRLSGGGTPTLSVRPSLPLTPLHTKARAAVLRSRPWFLSGHHPAPGEVAQVRGSLKGQRAKCGADRLSWEGLLVPA